LRSTCRGIWSAFPGEVALDEFVQNGFGYRKTYVYRELCATIF